MPVVRSVRRRGLSHRRFEAQIDHPCRQGRSYVQLAAPEGETEQAEDVGLLHVPTERAHQLEGRDRTREDPMSEQWCVALHARAVHDVALA